MCARLSCSFLQVIEDCHLGYGERRAPLFFEYVQANIAVAVNIRMEDFGFESNLQIFIRSAKHLRIIANKCSKKDPKRQKTKVFIIFYLYLGRFEGIIRREMDGYNEHTSSVGTIIWTDDGCLPVEHILSHRA